MFDLYSGEHKPASPGDATPLVISWSIHLLVIAGVVVPLLFVVGEPPEVPSMMAFVGSAPAPPPPPPPPAAPAARTPAPTKPVPTTGTNAAPIEAPSEIAPEPEGDMGEAGGVPGGVEGGVPGGVIGGVLGGLLDAPSPPPPPPAAPAPRALVRVGGEIQSPALVRRVAPVYPELAVDAQMEGVVILEAIVGRDGRVDEVQVLRSIPLLDNAAKAAVMQWQYSPLLLNGRPERFIVTVTVSFRLQRS